MTYNDPALNNQLPYADPIRLEDNPHLTGPGAGYLHPQRDPGRTLGLLGLIFTFVATPIGLVLSIIGLVLSRRAGHKNGLALAGIIASALLMVIGGVVLAHVLGNVAATCRELGPGVHVVGSITYTC